MSSLRTEIDAANTKTEEHQDKIKELELDQTKKEQDIASLTHKNKLLEEEVEKLEAKLSEQKNAVNDEQGSKNAVESLQRKVDVLEQELEASEKNVKETTEKYVILFSRYVEIVFFDHEYNLLLLY